MGLADPIRCSIAKVIPLVGLTDLVHSNTFKINLLVGPVDPVHYSTIKIRCCKYNPPVGPADLVCYSTTKVHRFTYNQHVSLMDPVCHNGAIEAYGRQMRKAHCGLLQKKFLMQTMSPHHNQFSGKDNWGYKSSLQASMIEVHCVYQIF